MPTMSLVGYHLTTEYLLTALLSIARPQRRTLPPSILEELQNLNSLDLYFKDQKLTPANSIAASDYSLITKTLAVQLLHGIKKNTVETANALRLWIGLLSMRTRSIRFASTKLVTGVIDELLILYCEPLNSTENPQLVTLTISELWARFLQNSWLDVNCHQRSLMLKKTAEWSLKCPQIFWNDTTVAIFSTCLVDDQDSVRSECMRQIKKLAFALDTSSVDFAPAWIPLLREFAENDGSPGLINKRVAIEVLSHLCQSGSMRGLSQKWCETILKSSLALNEPPATIACIMKLVWDDKAANLFSILCEVIMPGNSATLLGKGLALYKPNHAWEELTCALSVYEIIGGQKEYVFGVLAGLAQAIPDDKVYAVISSIFREETDSRFAAQLLRGINDTVPDIFDNRYFEVVAKLIDLQVEEVANVIELWTTKELQGGGLALLANRHEHVPFGLAGWVDGHSKYELAAKSRAILKEVCPEEIRSQFNELVSATESLDEDFLGDLREVEVLACSLARVYATLRSTYGRNICLPEINPEGFHRYIATHPTAQLEHWLQYLYELEVFSTN